MIGLTRRVGGTDAALLLATAVVVVSVALVSLTATLRKRLWSEPNYAAPICLSSVVTST